MSSAIEDSADTKDVKDEKDQEICRICGKDERGTEMLLCDGCDAGEHFHAPLLPFGL